MSALKASTSPRLAAVSRGVYESSSRPFTFAPLELFYKAKQKICTVCSSKKIRNFKVKSANEQKSLSVQRVLKLACTEKTWNMVGHSWRGCVYVDLGL